MRTRNKGGYAIANIETKCAVNISADIALQMLLNAAIKNHYKEAYTFKDLAKQVDYTNALLSCARITKTFQDLPKLQKAVIAFVSTVEEQTIKHHLSGKKWEEFQIKNTVIIASINTAFATFDLNDIIKLNDWLKGKYVTKERLTAAIKAVNGVGNEWLLWSQYAKKVVNGEEFAIVGNKYFSKSAVESMVPSGLGGSGIPPSVIDDIITNGEKAVFNGKSYNSSLDAVIMTESNGTIVRSITKVSNRTAETSLGLTNSLKATALEIEAATARIKAFRANGGSAGNYGYLHGNVKGNTINNKLWESGPFVNGEPQIFDAIEVAGSDGVKFLRNTDSEYKMLNKLASDLGGVKGQKYLDVTGELKIVSELPFCSSCRGVIKQFNEMFPNVKLIVVNGAR